MEYRSSRAPLPVIVALLALLTVLAALAIVIAGPGTRWGWWHFSTAFQIMRWGTYATIVFVILTLLAGVATAKLSRGRSLVVAAVATVIGGVAIYFPISMMRTARSVPAIHDITTDPTDPPSFVAILPRRADAANSAEYAGDSIARLQREAYPDVEPITLAVPPAQALERAQGVARDMGWDIVAVDTAAGRLEATARTPWFGFYDDVVVRVRAQGTGSRVDVRSVSRVGRSDVGMNAKRIREFTRRLRA
jgi:uncharacterized protein (DUF1499 family)